MNCGKGILTIRMKKAVLKQTRILQNEEVSKEALIDMQQNAPQAENHVWVKQIQDNTYI